MGTQPSCVKTKSKIEFKRPPICIQTKLKSQDIKLKAISSFFTIEHRQAILEILELYLPSIEASFICNVIDKFLSSTDINNTCYIRENKSNEFCMCWLLKDITGDRAEYNKNLCSRDKKLPSNRMNIYIFCQNKEFIPRLRLSALSDEQNNYIYRYVEIGKHKLELVIYANVNDGAYYDRWSILDRNFYKTIVLSFDVRDKTDFEYIKDKRESILSFCEDQPISFILCGYGLEYIYNSDFSQLLYDECILCDTDSKIEERKVSSFDAMQLAQKWNIPYIEIAQKQSHCHDINSNEQYSFLNCLLLKQCIYQFFITHQECYECPSFIKS